MEITERPPTRFDLPGRGEPVCIATQRWALEPWEGEDPPGLAKIWSRKPKFAVNGSRSCAELAIVHHLRNQGWHGIWVNSFGPRELRSEWFPAPAVKTLAETGAPAWAVEAFDRLSAANGGTLGGFFDVFAWREPGEVRCEAKAGPDRIKPTQLRFIELALRFHRSEQFMIIEVAGPSLRVHAEAAPGPATLLDTAPYRGDRATAELQRQLSWPIADQLRSRQDAVRRAARDLPRELDHVTGPDERETREMLRDVAAAIEARGLAAGMTDDQEGNLPRQPGCRLPRRSRAALPDLGHDRWPSARVLPVKHHAKGPRELGHILLPLRQLAESRVPLGDRLVPLDLPSQAHGCDGILQGDGRFACFDAFVSALHGHAGQVGDAGREELPLRTGRHGDVYPRRGPTAGRRRGVQQQPSAFRLADGQHGPDRAAARLWNLGILDPPAPCACVAIDRADALRQGEPLGSAPCSREIITIGRDHGGPHDAAHGRDDGAAGDMHDLALPRSGTSAHTPSRAAHSRANADFHAANSPLAAAWRAVAFGESAQVSRLGPAGARPSRCCDLPASASLTVQWHSRLQGEAVPGIGRNHDVHDCLSSPLVAAHQLSVSVTAR